jgi:hypothetical protein
MIMLLPILMLFFSGYAVGRLITIFSRKNEEGLFYYLLCGNIVLNFVFISLFIIFGVFTSHSHEFFLFFTLLLIVFLLIDFYYFIKFLYRIFINFRKKKLLPFLVNKYRSDYLFLSLASAISLGISLVIFHGALIYFHPIFNEYDSLYVFLPISKSILLGNGLNVDFFGGSDLSIRYPPFVQSIDAWIMDLFDYSALRIFPIYFIILTSLSIYYISRKLIHDKFLSLISISISLVIPALLVISSRFSLQQDLPFLAFLSYTILSFSNILYSENIKRIDFLMFIIAISLLPLTREIGLIISWSLLFILISFKFTKNQVIKSIFLILSFGPLYILSIYDLKNAGLTSVVLLRLTTLIIANICLIALGYRYKSTNFRSLFTLLPFFILFAIPISFILSNLILMKGPYPTIMFSEEFNNSLSAYRFIFDIHNKLFQNAYDALIQIPRIDLLFISTALGSIFVIFKIKGFIILIKNSFGDKKNFDFLLTFIIVLLIVWSYLLSSNFKEAGIRHIGYFIPFISIIIILGMKRGSTLNNVYIFSMVIFAFYYFTNFDLKIVNQGDHFSAIWIDPFKSEYIGISGLILGSLFFLGYVILGFVEKRLFNNIEQSPKGKYLNYIFPFLLCIFIFVLLSTNIKLAPLGTTDNNYYQTWENNIFDVINYLNMAEKGNVLSVRAPAIAYFTDRTNFDAYNPQIFGKIILPIFKSENLSSLEKKLDSNKIKYIVLPNTNNPLNKIVKNIDEKYLFKKLLKSDNVFTNVSLNKYDIYKFIGNGSSSITNLLNNPYHWHPFNVELLNFNPTLLLLSEVKDEDNGTQYNRIFLDTNISQSKKPLLLSLNYSSDIVFGKASFFYEIRDLHENRVLYTKDLGNTKGININKSFILPDNIYNKNIEMRFYIISNENGKYYLKISNLYLSHL